MGIFRFFPRLEGMKGGGEEKEGKEKANETRPSRPIRCDVWIVERMRYRPTDRPTNQRTEWVVESHACD